MRSQELSGDSYRWKGRDWRPFAACNVCARNAGICPNLNLGLAHQLIRLHHRPGDGWSNSRIPVLYCDVYFGYECFLLSHALGANVRRALLFGFYSVGRLP